MLLAPGQMAVRVRMFAGLRTLVGGGDLELAVPRGATVAVLRERLVEEHPVLEAFLGTMVCAIDEDVQPSDFVLPEGAVVDVIPPIAGGAESAPTVLYVCVQNAGRSQMASALTEQLARGRVRGMSAGSAPAAAVHPNVVTAMAEVGVDLSRARPKALSDVAVDEADIVVTMGCGDACPVVPGKRYIDWDLPDPAGLSIEETRRIRGIIRLRVEALLRELGAATARV